MLHSRIEPAGADGLIERVLTSNGTEQLAISGAKSLDRRSIEHQLVHGFQQYGLDAVATTLRQGIEAANGFDFIAEEIEP